MIGTFDWAQPDYRDGLDARTATKLPPSRQADSYCILIDVFDIVDCSWLRLKIECLAR
jgi:hypothetical protein